MEDFCLICYKELSDNERRFINALSKAYCLWKEKHEDEIKRLHKEIEWYQKQIDSMPKMR